MVKLIIVAIIALVVGGLIGFLIGYSCGAYYEATNLYGIKKNKRLKF